MAFTTVELLNKILTNTFLYVGNLKTLSQRGYSEETNKKLKEFLNDRESQSKELIGAINTMGGDVQSTPRHTDGEVISWCPSCAPKQHSTISLLEFLIASEEGSLNDYKKALNQTSSPKIRPQLQNHKKQGEATVKYLSTALQTNRDSSKA